MNHWANIAVRVDANSEVGLGHLRRCVTLMRQLRDDGFHVRLIGRYRFGRDIEPLLAEFPHSWLEDVEVVSQQQLTLTDEVHDAEATLAIIGRDPAGSSWVIVDHYGLGERWERIMREAGYGVLVIDDFRTRRHCADLLVSDTSAPFDPALNGGPGAAREFVGAQYAIVDPEFAFAAETSSSGDRLKRLLVSYGGSDSTDETIKALEAVRLLRQSEPGRAWLDRVDVVVGPANTRKADVLRSARDLENVSVHVAPKSLAPLMRQADLFLTAGGNSMVESLTMRKPCLVTLTSDNQALMVAHLLEQRVIVSLGDHSKVGPLDVAQAVTGILSEYEPLAQRIREQPVFDHLGARRTSAALQAAIRERATVIPCHDRQ